MGVSCHFVDERFDTGDLVEVERFAIDPDGATAALARPGEPGAAGRPVRAGDGPADRRGGAAAHASGEGRYVDREEFEPPAAVAPGDDLGESCAPSGIRLAGRGARGRGGTLTLVDEALLADAAAAYRGGTRAVAAM